ncbi:unnamed protein product [Urochloa decumbens]|uniref:Uncharacterized protein n=1 Tax=Urochloa decumbens TaxID=240449 RepID=A0ABC9CVJ2_9POAL
MAGGNHFALLESDDPGDTRLDNKNQQQPAASLTQELFGRAYPSAWKIIRNRERQQQNGAAAGQAKKNAKDGVAGGARTDKKKGAGRQDGGRAAAENEARALRLFDLAQFPSLK